MEKKIDIHSDLSRNRLYMSFSGFFLDDEVKQAVDKVIAEGRMLKPGFDIINDISDFKPATPAGAAEIKRAQLFFKECGVKRVIRVTGQSSIAEAQFSRLAKEASYTSGAAAETAMTIGEAERMLDSR